jgi:lipopolysaccharide transport system permease protein
MYATPVVYSISLVPEKWRPLYGLNPMVGVVEGFRWAMLGRSQPDWSVMGISTGVTMLLLLGGLYFFRRAEATFADVI